MTIEDDLLRAAAYIGATNDSPDDEASISAVEGDRIAGVLRDLAGRVVQPGRAGVPAVAPALSDDEAAQEFMRWNLPGNDAALEFHELDTNAQVRRAFVDGVRRGLVLAAARGVTLPRGGQPE